MRANICNNHGFYSTRYLKGRVTYEKVNTFIELLNRVLSSKYAIFKKRKATLKKKDADLWNEFYKQELKETKGKIVTPLTSAM